MFLCFQGWIVSVHHSKWYSLPIIASRFVSLWSAYKTLRGHINRGYRFKRTDLQRVLGADLMSSAWQNHGRFCRHIEHECNEIVPASSKIWRKDWATGQCNVGLESLQMTTTEGCLGLTLQWRPWKTEVRTAFYTYLPRGTVGTMKNLPNTEPGMLNLHYQLD